MTLEGRHVAASVQARRLQLSRNSKLSLQDLLERYCTERLLYRLSRSRHHSRFILKGAILMIVWGESSSPALGNADSPRRDPPCHGLQLFQRSPSRQPSPCRSRWGSVRLCGGRRQLLPPRRRRPAAAAVKRFRQAGPWFCDITSESALI